jgi:rare lipoprotein A
MILISARSVSTFTGFRYHPRRNGTIHHASGEPEESHAIIGTNGMKNVFVLLVLIVALAGCAHKKRAAKTPPPPSRAAANLPPVVKPGDTETGLASWYGRPYHGRQAADGEIYDMETLVAAHRTLPFNTWVRVYDLDNERTVDVRIIDRGPFVDGRIIDLSHAAARDIGMIGPGTARVRIEVTRIPAEVIGVFAVQVGAFQDRSNAERICDQMQSRYGTARLVLRQGKPDMWRVLVGSEPTEDAANALSARIRQESGEKNGFVVRLDSE